MKQRKTLEIMTVGFLLCAIILTLISVFNLFKAASESFLHMGFWACIVMAVVSRTGALIILAFEQKS
jgi:hypothetical protein